MPDCKVLLCFKMKTDRGEKGSDPEENKREGEGWDDIYVKDMNTERKIIVDGKAKNYQCSRKRKDKNTPFKENKCKGNPIMLKREKDTTNDLQSVQIKDQMSQKDVQKEAEFFCHLWGWAVHMICAYFESQTLLSKLNIYNAAKGLSERETRWPLEPGRAVWEWFPTLSPAPASTHCCIFLHTSVKHNTRKQKACT